NDKMAYVHFISDVTNERVQKEQLESLAFKDELTGLFNRRYGMQMLDNLVSGKKEFTVCMVDLDGLKYVNDSKGHLVGDDYIITVANAMLEIQDEDSVTCRVGGDEFIIIFPNYIEANAREKVNLLNKKISLIQKNIFNTKRLYIINKLRHFLCFKQYELAAGNYFRTSRRKNVPC
ncbi:MAG: GGDEF domain-containing protein, partial [Hydrogenoanaerobacterium sp.]